MKKHSRITKYVAALAAMVAAQALAYEGESVVGVAMEEGVPGGAIVAAQELTATVDAIEVETRKVTLVMPDGAKTAYQAGPAVANFDQIKVGDQLSVVAVEAIAVAVYKGDEPAEDTAAAGAALAPLGEKPGMLIGDAVTLHATVTALDLTGRTAVIEFADGGTKTVQVRDDVDLGNVAVGDHVAIRLVEALLVRVTAP